VKGDLPKRGIGGNLSETGCVSFFAHRREVVEYRKNDQERGESMKAKKNKRERSSQMRAS
jgi:transcriptional/translational regulatory protein YebC/TACO1